jgi:hypothetical protein
MHLDLPTTLLLLLIPALAAPSIKQPTVKTIYQFPNPTWVENIHSLSNGSVLVSIVASAPAELHIVHPSLSSAPGTSNLVHAFTGSNTISGIAEYRPNVFSLIVGNYNLSTGAENGSWSVWSADLSSKVPGAKAKVKKIADVPSATFFNGAAALNPYTVLLAASYDGNVWAIDTRTGKTAVVLDDESMKATGTGPVKIGVNGLKIHNGYLYYTNSIQNTFNRVKVDPVTGHAIGPFENVAENLYIPDDFDFERDVAYVAQPLLNEIRKVDKKGVATLVVGGLNDTTVAGVTSVAAGRGKARGVVFAGTNGGLSGPVNGTFTEGGMVVGIWV